MIDRLLSEHGVEFLTTVVQTLLATIAFTLGSARLVKRTITKLPDDLEDRFAAVRRKWAGKEVARHDQ